MAVKILAEWVGLGPDATEEQIAEKIKTLGEDVKTYRDRAETYEKALAENHAAVQRAKTAEKKYQSIEGTMLIEQAVRDQKIDVVDVPFLSEMYEKSPERVKKFIEEKAYRSILAKQVSLSGDAAPSDDPQVELSVRVAEAMANDTTKALTEAVAVQRIYKADPGLFRRVTEARRAASAAPKGGER
jgi:hypothetical protein